MKMRHLINLAHTHQKRVKDANQTDEDTDDMDIYSSCLVEGQSGDENNNWQP